ncbi:MAG TPA: cupin domain-containing protein [Firmicutes bacterium]|nr:cupin domain-containing protein [Bacillota bacterium]
MIRRSYEMSVASSVRLKDGHGEADIVNILEPEDMFGAGRLFCITKMKPGVSSGPHFHTGDFETYYILKGRALANDNGKLYELEPGDMLQCKDGDFHAIECIGEEELEYLAVIMYSR